MTMKKIQAVLIATFSPWKDGKRLPTNGMVEPFVDYFSKRSEEFVLIDEPHPGSDILMPKIEIYKNGKQTKILKNSFWLSFIKPILSLTNVHKTQISFKLRDFLSVLDYVIRSKRTFDLYIGFESINALAGVILKKLGKIDSVVYYVSDFSPRRYKNKWFNTLYILLDKLAATHADATWNVSQTMSEARKKLGYDMKKLSPQLYAPNAFFEKDIHYFPIAKVKPFSIVYAGTLGQENGPDLAIKAMPTVLKMFPKATLTLIGGGQKEDQNNLIELINKLNLHKSVNYKGFISTNEEMYEIVRKHMVSVAPYRAIPGSVRWYADAVKIRTSLACGLPVITTQVPPNGKLVEKAGAGIVTKDNPEDIAGALIKIFSDKNLYLKMRENAIASAKENTWDNSYSNALKQMGFL